MSGAPLYSPSLHSYKHVTFSVDCSWTPQKVFSRGGLWDKDTTMSLTFLKTLSYPGSALRKLSVSLPESLWSVEGQLAVLLVLLGKLGDAEDCEGPGRHDNTMLTLKYNRFKHREWSNVKQKTMQEKSFDILISKTFWYNAIKVRFHVPRDSIVYWKASCFKTICYYFLL